LIYQELNALYKAIKWETDIIRKHPLVRRYKLNRADIGDHKMAKKLDDRLPADEMLQSLFEEAASVQDALNVKFRQKFFGKLKESDRGNDSGRYEDRRRDDRYSGDYRSDRHSRSARYDREKDRYGRRRSGERYR